MHWIYENRYYCWSNALGNTLKASAETAAKVGELRGSQELYSALVAAERIQADVVSDGSVMLARGSYSRLSEQKNILRGPWIPGAP